MKIESVYLLAGPEAGKRAAFAAELRAAIEAADRSPPEQHRLYASEAGDGELLGLLRNGSLFASRRLVEYRGAELGDEGVALPGLGTREEVGSLDLHRSLNTCG